LFGRLFRRRKKYKLILARRGTPLVIAEITARSIEEAKEEAMEIIDNMPRDQVPDDFKKYKWFKLVSEDESEKTRIRNPFHEEEEVDLELKPETIEKVAMAAIVERIPDIVSKAIDMSIQPALQLQSKLMNTAIDTATKFMKETFEKMLGIENPDKAFKEELRRTIVDLLNNPEKLALAWRIVKEGKIPVKTVAKQREGGGNVEEGE
jgi:hypothetical protein